MVEPALGSNFYVDELFRLRKALKLAVDARPIDIDLVLDIVNRTKCIEALHLLREETKESVARAHLHVVK